MRQSTRAQVTCHNLADLDAVLGVKAEAMGVRALLLAGLEVLAVLGKQLCAHDLIRKRKDKKLVSMGSQTRQLMSLSKKMQDG